MEQFDFIGSGRGLSRESRMNARAG